MKEWFHFNPIIEGGSNRGNNFRSYNQEGVLTEGMVPLQMLLQYLREPLSSNHQRMNLYQVLIILTPLVQVVDVLNVKTLDILPLIVQIIR